MMEIGIKVETHSLKTVKIFEIVIVNQVNSFLVLILQRTDAQNESNPFQLK